MPWDCVSIFQWSRKRVTLPLLYYHSLCISPEFFLFPSRFPLHASSSRISLLRGCVWCNFPRGGQARGSYGWAVHFPHPSLIPEEPSTYQPGSNLFQANESLLVLLASEVRIWYRFRWKLMPPFQVPPSAILQPSWSLFQHTPPLSSPAIYIYIHNIIYIHQPFSQGPFTSHIHIFEFSTILGQYSYFYRLGETGCYMWDQ